jgi:hypothetical protein
VSTLEIIGAEISYQQSAAEQEAARNWAGNLRALASTQPALVEALQGQAAGVEWVYGRDGALTAMETGQWHGGCSVPRQAARQLLKTLNSTGTVACYLSPTHAQQLKVAMDLFAREQAVIAIIPATHDLRVMLQCADFSDDIEQHRLWFCWGETWKEELQHLLQEREGLPVPAQFIRTALVEERSGQALIAAAQEVFNSITSSRAHSIEQSWTKRSAPAAGAVKRLCVLAPSRFRLWENAADALLQAMRADESAGIDVTRFDSDDPASASPLALARIASACDAILAAGTGRADLPGIVALDTPWITWVTAPRIPARSGAGDKDMLLLADEGWMSAALQQGWEPDRVQVAAWPAAQARQHDPSAEQMARWADRYALGSRPSKAGSLAIIVNTTSICPSPELDLSSHRLLWEMILAELTTNPFTLPENLDGYLCDRRAKLGIDEAGFDRAQFINELIVPAYQQGLARVLIEEGLPLRVWGSGWEEIDEFAGRCGGPVRSSAELAAVIEEAAALVHVWPHLHLHPIDAAGKPVVRRCGDRGETFAREAKLALRGEVRLRPGAGPVLSSHLMCRLLAGTPTGL